MIRFFRRKKQRPTLMYTGFQKMGVAVDKQQRKWADYLNGKTNQTTQRSKMIGLVVFCFLFGGSAVYLMFSGITNPSDNIVIDKISQAGNIILVDSNAGIIPLPILSDQEIKRIEAFEKFMDDLNKTPAGKIKYDSICKARPGLMDSLDFIKQLFHQQSKTR